MSHFIETGWLRLLPVVGISGALLTAACGPAAPPRVTSAPTAPTVAVAPLSPPVAVKVGHPGTSPAVPVYVALERGYFKEEGLDVELVLSAGELIPAISTGQVDFGVTVPDPGLFNALERGVNITIVAPASTNRETDRTAVLLVRSDLLESGAYRSAADLKGATIAAATAAGEMNVERFLARGGLTRADVNFVTMRPPDMLPALSNRAVAAAWEIEPLATAAEQQGLGKPVATVGQVFPNAATQMLVMSPSIGRGKPEVARRFVIAYLRGLRDYYHAFNKNDGPRKPVVEALMKHTSVKDAALYDVIGMHGVDPNARLDLSAWNEFQDYFLKRGLQKTKLDLAAYVDWSYAESAVERLGEER